VRDHRIHVRDLHAVIEALTSEPVRIVGWSLGGNIALATAIAHPASIAGLCLVEAPFHGLRHADRTVLSTVLRLKLNQLRRRPIEAAEVFFRFGTTGRSGANTYDGAPEHVKQNLRSNHGPVLAEWDHIPSV
jgi:pimeloyl-ACP methyl ester carboxylesterase